MITDFIDISNNELLNYLLSQAELVFTEDKNNGFLYNHYITRIEQEDLINKNYLGIYPTIRVYLDTFFLPEQYPYCYIHFSILSLSGTNISFGISEQLHPIYTKALEVGKKYFQTRDYLSYSINGSQITWSFLEQRQVLEKYREQTESQENFLRSSESFYGTDNKLYFYAVFNKSYSSNLAGNVSLNPTTSFFLIDRSSLVELLKKEDLRMTIENTKKYYPAPSWTPDLYIYDWNDKFPRAQRQSKE